MRLSIALRSGHGPGSGFGNFTKSYGFYRIGLASNEQKPWKGFAYGCWKPVKEQLRDWWMLAIPGFMTYLIYDWAKKEHDKWRRQKDH